MPTYDYKCISCSVLTSVMHRLDEVLETCPTCGSYAIKKTIAPFSAKTENTLEHRQRMYVEQGQKDVAKFYADDTFAANISGYDDPNSSQRMKKHLEEMKAKNDSARSKVKKIESKKED